MFPDRCLDGSVTVSLGFLEWELQHPVYARPANAERLGNGVRLEGEKGSNVTRLQNIRMRFRKCSVSKGPKGRISAGIMKKRAARPLAWTAQVTQPQHTPKRSFSSPQSRP